MERHKDDVIFAYPPNISSQLTLLSSTEIEGIAFCSLSCHNGKKANQDRVLVYLDQQSQLLIVGIFDGHGIDGHLVATYVRNTFLTEFLDSNMNPSFSTVNSAHNALRIAEKSLISNPSINSKRSGCTANIGVLSKSENGGLLLTNVNVGDSECVISVRSANQMNYNILQVNIPHCPTLPEEMDRINRCGGFVIENQLTPYVPSVPRVYADASLKNGGLSMSRSLGDVLIHRFGVISDASIENISLSHEEFAASQIFLVIGSDGLLSYMDKTDILSPFWNSKDSLQKRIEKSCTNAYDYMLHMTSGKYADDTSGIVIQLRIP